MRLGEGMKTLSAKGEKAPDNIETTNLDLSSMSATLSIDIHSKYDIIPAQPGALAQFGRATDS